MISAILSHLQTLRPVDDPIQRICPVSTSIKRNTRPILSVAPSFPRTSKLPVKMASASVVSDASLRKSGLMRENRSRPCFPFNAPWYERKQPIALNRIFEVHFAIGSKWQIIRSMERLHENMMWQMLGLWCGYRCSSSANPSENRTAVAGISPIDRCARVHTHAGLSRTSPVQTIVPVRRSMSLSLSK